MFGHGLGFADANAYSFHETIRSRQTSDGPKIDRDSYIQLNAYREKIIADRQIKPKGSRNKNGSVQEAPTFSMATYRELATLAGSEDRGLIPRTLIDIFEQIAEKELQVNVYCSFIQIYNERLYDLLQLKNSSSLQIREDKW